MQYKKSYVLFLWCISYSLFSFNDLVENINKNDIDSIQFFLDSTSEDNIKKAFKTKEKVSGNTPMLIAANKNHLNIVKLFLEKQGQTGININESNKNNDTLLHIICRNNVCKVSKNNSIHDLNNDQDINILSDSDESYTDSLLGKRTRNENNLQIDIVKNILNHQHLNLKNIQNLQKNTPLSFTIINNNNDAFDLFIIPIKEMIKNNDINNNELLDLLKTSIESSHKKSFKLFIKKISDLNNRSQEFLKLAINNLNIQKKDSFDVYKEIINSNKIKITLSEKINLFSYLNKLDIETSNKAYKIAKKCIESSLNLVDRKDKNYYENIYEFISLSAKLNKRKKAYKIAANYLTDYENSNKINNKNLIKKIKNIIQILNNEDKHLIKCRNKVLQHLSYLIFNQSPLNMLDIDYLFDLNINAEELEVIAKNIIKSCNFADIFKHIDRVGNFDNNVKNINMANVNKIIFENKKDFQTENVINFYINQLQYNCLSSKINSYFINYINSSEKLAGFIFAIASMIKSIELSEDNYKIWEKILLNNKSTIYEKNIEPNKFSFLPSNVSCYEFLIILLNNTTNNKNILQKIKTSIDSMENSNDKIDSVDEIEVINSVEEINTVEESMQNILLSLNNNNNISSIQQRFENLISAKNNIEIADMINNQLINNSNILDILIVHYDMAKANDSSPENIDNIKKFIKRLINLNGKPKFAANSSSYLEILNKKDDI